jgi:hypothetical protein
MRVESGLPRPSGRSGRIWPKPSIEFPLRSVVTIHDARVAPTCRVSAEPLLERKFGAQAFEVSADCRERVRDDTWGKLKIRVKSGHKAAGGVARTRLAICPTTPRLALPAIFFWI